MIDKLTELTGLIWPVLIIFTFSIVCYAALVNWLGLPSVFAIFFEVVIIGVLIIIVSRSIHDLLHENKEKLEEISEKIDDLEDLISKRQK